jgi:hypothetical protein
MRSVLLFSAAAGLAAEPARAVVIDDFSVGPAIVDGPGQLDQSNLGGGHVLGGTRRITVGQFGSGSRLEVTDAGRLRLSSSSNGYFTIVYGGVEPLSGVDLTAGGHDRLLIRFGDVGPGFHPLGVYISLPSSSSSNGESMYVRDSWDGVLVEIPFAAFPASFGDVQSITLDGFRNPPGSWFEIESIYTSAPAVAGDYNRDGVIDGADLAEWSLAAGNSGTSGSWAARFTADGNGDGRVDGADFLAWQQALGEAQPPLIAAPEPASVGLALPPLACAAYGARRRRTTRAFP